MRDPVFPFATDESVYYDTSAAARDLAWQPAYGLQRGIRDAYDWRLRDRAGKPQPAPASASGFARDERILARLRRA